MRYEPAAAAAYTFFCWFKKFIPIASKSVKHLFKRQWLIGCLSTLVTQLGFMVDPPPTPSLAPARSNPLPPIGTDVQTVVDDVDFVAPSSISNHYGRENKKKAGLGIGRYSYKRNLSHKKCLASIYSLLSFRWSCFKSRDLFQSSIATVCSIF